MATDVNKLVIEVTTKNVKEAKKDVDALVTSSKKLGETTKATTKTNKEASEQQGKFTTATTAFRNELPNVASGLYLIQQAYGLLSSAMANVEEAYEAQFTSEIKLQAILKTTGNAVGYTTEQIYRMSEAWASMTGINDAVLNEAYAIGATFVDISKEVFPDLIEQALNMSTIFNQDLKQSIIQLGVATNNLQVSRLTRIGISFTDQQKEQIRVLRESGQVLEAQQVIMAELEREIGGVAIAMGETTIAKIKKFSSAWTDAKEEIGEASIGIKASILEFVSATKIANNIELSFGKSNALKELEGQFAGGTIQKGIVVATTSFRDYALALSGAGDELKILQANVGTFGYKSGKGKEDNDADIAYYTNLIQLIRENLVLKQKFEDDTQIQITEDDEAKKQKQIAEGLKERADRLKEFTDLADKSRIAGIDDKYEKERETLLVFWNDLILKAKELGVSEKELEHISGEYFNVTMAQINAREILEKQIAAEKKLRSDRELLAITDEQKNYAELETTIAGLTLAYRESYISAEEFTEAVANANSKWEGSFEKKDPEEAMSVTSWDGIFDAFLNKADKATIAADTFKVAMDDLLKSMMAIGVSGITGTLNLIGVGLQDGSKFSETFGQSMLNLMDATIEALGPQLILAGTSSIIGGNPAVGIPLIVAGAAMGVLGGYLDFSGSSSSGSVAYTNGYSSTLVDPNNILPISNDSSSRSMSGPANVTYIDKTSGGTSINATTNADGSVLLEVMNKNTKAKYNVNERTVAVSS